MKTFLRLCLPAVLLFAACYGQRGLTQHLRAAMLPPGHQFKPALTKLPHTIGAWCGEDENLGIAPSATGDSLIRNYFHATTGDVATVCLTYSPTGQPPAGQANGDARWVFRRFYALPILHEPRLDPLQTFYRRLRITPPHVTVEIFVPDNFPTDAEAASEFVRLVDAAMIPVIASVSPPPELRIDRIKLVSN